MYPPDRRYLAFSGHELIADGTLAQVAIAAKNSAERLSAEAPLGGAVLVFDAETSEPVELDLRGTIDDVVARYEPERLPEPTPPDPEARPAPTRSPGRPKLGVVSREVTLLPRHWEWLASQPGGASVTLRRLVETARRQGSASDRQRRACDSAYRFMVAIAGDEPGFEEAARALWADDAERFATLTAAWPEDVRAHADELASTAFTAMEAEE